LTERARDPGTLRHVPSGGTSTSDPVGFTTHVPPENCRVHPQGSSA